jgi:hypothetical protein
MSNVSNRHTVNPFVAGKSDPLSGQRLARVGYKKTKDNPNPLPSICVSVPPIDQTAITGDILAGLMPSIVVMLQDAQDGIIRAMNDASGGTLTEVSDDDISLAAVVAFLSAKNAGERLSADSIGAWFTRYVEDNLSVVVADKLGFDDITDDNQATIDKHTKVYADICAMLAGKNLTRASLSEKQKNAVKVCVKIASDDNGIGEKLTQKLVELEKKVEITDMLELDI